jgi:hypothetical protein
MHNSNLEQAILTGLGRSQDKADGKSTMDPDHLAHPASQLPKPKAK